MAKRRQYLTATLPDGYVKTIGPTAAAFTHYWRIVATLESGRTEVFWGHTTTLAEARRKRTATQDAARQRGWRDHRFEIVELTRSDAPPGDARTARRRDKLHGQGHVPAGRCQRSGAWRSYAADGGQGA